MKVQHWGPWLEVVGAALHAPAMQSLGVAGGGGGGGEPWEWAKGVRSFGGKWVQTSSDSDRKRVRRF